MTEALVIAIERALEQRRLPALEAEVFGSREPRAIAAELDRFCRAELGVHVAGCLFYATGTGCVAGLVLADGRQVVLKAHAPALPETRLAACSRIQAELFARGFPCPEPLLGPRPLRFGLAGVERYVARGVRADAHDPAIRDELAARLAELVSVLAVGRDRTRDAGLGGSWFGSLPAERLWPRQPAARFDFAGTSAGAEWIDALARRARAVPLAGERVIAHFDWRAEHCLFEAGRLHTAYDWDSLHLEREPIAAGAAAHAFTAQWDRADIDPAPSLEEIRGFIAGYERARGRAFDRDERRTAAAACVYALAFTARCEHAREGTRDAARATAFRTLLQQAGPALLDAT